MLDSALSLLPLHHHHHNHVLLACLLAYLTFVEYPECLPTYFTVPDPAFVSPGLAVPCRTLPYLDLFTLPDLLIAPILSGHKVENKLIMFQCAGRHSN